jgi:hypothetical protein
MSAGCKPKATPTRWRCSTSDGSIWRSPGSAPSTSSTLSCARPHPRRRPRDLSATTAAVLLQRIRPHGAGLIRRTGTARMRRCWSVAASPARAAITCCTWRWVQADVALVIIEATSSMGTDDWQCTPSAQCPSTSPPADGTRITRAAASGTSGDPVAGQASLQTSQPPPTDLRDPPTARFDNPVAQPA